METDDEFDGALMLHTFEALKKPRSCKCLYPLDELLLAALSAVTSGANDWVSVVKWAELRLEWLRCFLPFDSGIASHDTFSRVFSLLNAQCFEACFVACMRPLCPTLAGHTVAIESRGPRGSPDDEVGMGRLVSAWRSGAGMALGELKIGGKSNETISIPALLDMLDVRGATITMDATGCQPEIAGQVVDRNANYIVAVRNNQPTLAQAVESLFDAADANAHDGWLRRDVTLGKDHGCIETQCCVVAHDLSAISEHVRAWPQLHSAVMVQSTRELVNGLAKGGKLDTQWRYYISNLEFDGVDIHRLIRSHWSIENNFHWLLDVSFDEDACRVRAEYGEQNLAILRRIALNLLNRENSTKSAFAKRLQAVYSTEYLQTVLGLTPR